MRYLIVGLLLILLLEVHGVKFPKKDRIRQRHQQELQLRHTLQLREEKSGNSSQFVDGKSKFNASICFTNIEFFFLKKN